jgi:hypothetical protein
MVARWLEPTTPSASAEQPEVPTTSKGARWAEAKTPLVSVERPESARRLEPEVPMPSERVRRLELLSR